VGQEHRRDRRRASFLLAALGGSEQEVFLWLAYDGIECQYLKHSYVCRLDGNEIPKDHKPSRADTERSGAAIPSPNARSSCTPRSSPSRDDSALRP
jgi:hypothetical protein